MEGIFHKLHESNLQNSKVLIKTKTNKLKHLRQIHSMPEIISSEAIKHMTKIFRCQLNVQRGTLFFKILFGDFPDGSVVEKLPSNAGDTCPIPGRGTKIPHAGGQLSPRAATKILCAATNTRSSQINK